MNQADFDVDSAAQGLADIAAGSAGSPVSVPTSVPNDAPGQTQKVTPLEAQREAERGFHSSGHLDTAGVAQAEPAGMLLTETLSPHPTLWQFDIDTTMHVVDSRAPLLAVSTLVITATEQGISVGHPNLDLQIRSIVASTFDGQTRQQLLESARGPGCRLMVVARHLGAVVRLELLDLDSQIRFPCQLLSDLFSLTQTECIIVRALVNGQTLREYAESNGVSRNTVRTHLKSVFMKTRTHRQADLVKLVQLVCMSYPHHVDTV